MMIKTSHKFRDMACVGEIVQLLNEITNETAEFHAFLSTFPSIQLHSVMRCGVYVCVCIRKYAAARFTGKHQEHFSANAFFCARLQENC